MEFTTYVLTRNIVCPPEREIIHELKLVDYLPFRRTNRGITILRVIREEL